MGDKVEPLLYTIEEAATAMHMSRSGIYRAIAEGRLVARKNLGRTVIERAEIDRFISELPTIAGIPKEG